MDESADQNIIGLKLEMTTLEANRRRVFYKKIVADETRLSECIDDIMDLHRDLFHLPETENKRGCIKNDHAQSRNKPKCNVVELYDLVNTSQDSVKKRFYAMFPPEKLESEWLDFEDESHNSDDNSRGDETELAKKALSDLLIDGEIEIIRLVKTLIDNFLLFGQKLAAIKNKPSKANNDIFMDLGRRVVELDELVSCIHTKYSEMIDML